MYTTDLVVCTNDRVNVHNWQSSVYNRQSWSFFFFFFFKLKSRLRGEKRSFSESEICKGYRPEARGYVIYSPRALPQGAPRGQRTRGINHITTSWRAINGLFLHWRGFLKGCKNTLTKNAAIVHLSFVL